ncbi:alpha/beta hydrolase [Pseudomonas aeruginosa]|uniref:alpha/beta fold hydrolase n=1 Tax=Pseudomonas aeruginosa TaxID=287 RepID=UPI00071B1745|nr:alpha/beta fold hydrolase [Pseudomonas aeruginosa]KSN96424.1 alpha/beta hydrolase [Pseudomonas aeruginosa]
MSSLTWIRGFNGTIGRIAPRWTAERMRRTFMVPGEWPPKDWELPLLASSERVTLRFGLSVLRWGEGPAVLLLHGWAGRPTQFAHLIEQLVGAGYSVYALDAPAHGRSPGREANVVLFAHALLEAAGELPPLRAVVGHSLGGAAALLAAQMGLRSEALVTVSAPSRILEQLRLFARFVGLPALARSHFIRLVERQAGISAACLDVARYRLEMPGLVVHADDDTRVAVENAERIHAAWPASRLLRLPGGGHHHHRLLGERRLSESLLALLEERPAMRACRRVEKTASAS